MSNKIILSFVFIIAVIGGIYVMRQPEKTTESVQQVSNETETDTNSEIITDLQVSNSATITSTPTTPALTSVTPQPVTTSTPTATTPTNTTVKTVTMAEVAQNNNANSCWSVIDTSVYNLTEWISKHPGGSRGILSICGTDGTAAFTRQHGNSKNAQATLTNYYFAQLK